MKQPDIYLFGSSLYTCRNESYLTCLTLLSSEYDHAFYVTLSNPLCIRLREPSKIPQGRNLWLVFSRKKKQR